MELRELSENDLASLIELYKQLDEINNNLSLEDAKQNWKIISVNRNIKYFGVVENGIVLSTCYCVIIPNLTHFNKSICYIENVVTDKNHRMKGLGRQVINMALDFAKKNNCYKAVLFSSRKRTEAHKFYAKLGFDPDAKKAFCYSFT